MGTIDHKKMFCLDPKEAEIQSISVKERGVTMIELLVVIVLMIIGSTVFLNLGGWNCSSEVRSDFDHFNQFLETLRAKSIATGRAMQAEYHLEGLLHVHSNVGRQERGTQPCSGGEWDWEGEEVDLLMKRANFQGSENFVLCFYPDGTATAKTIGLQGTCDGEVHRFRTQVFGATGFLDRAKQKVGTGQWQEL